MHDNSKENLTKLFVKDGDEKRRRLIVDLDAPQFASDDNILTVLENQK